MRLGTSGIRGEYGKDIKASLAYEVANKFSKGKKTLYIGKDIRTSSYALYYAAIAGALARGTNVIPVDTIATGILGYLGNGIMITASHNPETDNGIKFFENGMELTKEEDSFLMNEIFEAGEGFIMQEDVFKKYLNALEKIEFDFTLEPMDVNSSALTFFHYYISQTREKLLLINNLPYMVRKSEPITENLNIERGLAFDADGDRVVIVRDKKVLDGDRVFAAIGKYMAENRGKDKLIVTVDCSLAVKRYLSKFYNKIEVVKVGSSYIAKKIDSKSFGGEPNGHYTISEVSKTTDGIAGAAIITEMLKNKAFELPELENIYIVRKKYPVKDKIAVMAKIKEKLKDYVEFDGLLIEKDDLKVLIRPSGTENLIRLTVESKNKFEYEYYDKIILEASNSY
jgi:phosphoglucosamine mutase